MVSDHFFCLGFFFSFCQIKRKKETLSPPQGSIAEGEELLWLARGGRRPPSLESWHHLGSHWGDVCSCLEHNCQWKNLSTDFGAQKHCGLGHFGEDF